MQDFLATGDIRDLLVPALFAFICVVYYIVIVSEFVQLQYDIMLITSTIWCLTKPCVPHAILSQSCRPEEVQVLQAGEPPGDCVGWFTQSEGIRFLPARNLCGAALLPPGLPHVSITLIIASSRNHYSHHCFLV